MDAPEILVTGGTGLLGSRVVERLVARGARARILSHSGRADTIRGDLLTGEGLKQAVDGVGTIVHCASSPTKTRQVDVEGTRRLLQAADRAGVSHIVFISIVGVDLNLYFPYYHTKLEVERTVERSPVPWTILRATQFHDFVLRLIRSLERLPVLLAPKGVLLQPIDAAEVADHLTELAFSEPLGHVPDVGSGGQDLRGTHTLLSGGDRMAEEGGGGSVAGQDGAGLARGGAAGAGSQVRQTPVGRVSGPNNPYVRCVKRQ